MTTERLQQRSADFQKAVQRLREVLEANPTDPFVYDAALQRFEFTYELAWKLVKTYLEHSGIAEINSPRSAFREAFAAGIIKDGALWMDMLGDRNLTSHTYNEELAVSIYQRVKGRYFQGLVLLSNTMAELIWE